MRKTFKYIIAAASLFLSTAVFAQTRPSTMADGDTDPYAGLKVYKVSTMNPDGTATITLDTYVTGHADGEAVSKPVNAVLVLDISGSMGYSAKAASLDTDKGSVKGYYGYTVSSRGGTTRYLLWYDKSAKAWKQTVNNEDEDYQLLTSSPSDPYITRIGMLKDAVKVFAGMLNKDYHDNGTKHKLRIITYNGENDASSARDVFAMGVMNDDNYNTVISSVNSIHPQNGTPADHGMSLAANTVFDEVSERVVLHVTDGKPGQTSFEYVAAANLVTSARTLKVDKSAKVWSISIVDFSSDSDATKMADYLGHSSSNYPDATADVTTNRWGTVNGIKYTGSSQDTKYYLPKVTDPETLKQTFKDIVGSALSDAADCKDINDESVVLDVMSPDFTIPDNASNIRVYKLRYIEPGATFNENGFEEPTTPTTELSVEVVTRKDPKGNDVQALQVTNFDYSANWCGPRIVRDKQDHHIISVTPHGNKIHIVFDVVPTETGEGGVTSTNNADSGIMVDGNVVKNYPRQVDKVMNSMDLKIVKTGLAAGATAIYSVSDGTNSWIVSLTSETDGAEAKATLRVPFHNDENNIISYTVSELDWNYTSSATAKSITKRLYKTVTSVDELLHSSDPESLKDNVFTFDSTSSSLIDAKYRDESATPNNVFE